MVGVASLLESCTALFPHGLFWPLTCVWAAAAWQGTGLQRAGKLFDGAQLASQRQGISGCVSNLVWCKRKLERLFLERSSVERHERVSMLSMVPSQLLAEIRIREEPLLRSVSLTA